MHFSFAWPNYSTIGREMSILFRGEFRFSLGKENFALFPPFLLQRCCLLVRSWPSLLGCIVRPSSDSVKSKDSQSRYFDRVSGQNRARTSRPGRSDMLHFARK